MQHLVLAITAGILGMSFACASAPLPATTASDKDLQQWASQPTTLTMLDHLAEERSRYQIDRSHAQSRLAYAERLMNAPDERATENDLWAPLRSSISRSAAAIRYRKAAAEIVEIDAGWHDYLMGALSNAPEVMDFDSRAVALGLSPEQARPYWALFQIVQQGRFK